MNETKAFELNITEEIKIKRYDERNFELLVKSTFPQVSEDAPEEGYRRVGFYGTIKQALRAVLRHDLMVDLEKIRDLNDYNAQLEQQFAIISALL